MRRDDHRFMARALELARAPAFTSPNPRVGAVVVRDGEILAEGAHRGPGTPHAEAAAVGSVDARGATVYVSLEPCVHHGRTPPCVPLLVSARLARVVIAMEDPDARVRGKGVTLLRAGGIEVTTGVLEAEARRMNSAYLRHRVHGLPFVSLKLALSLDGRLAAADRSARWITGAEARARVHERRVEADAVLVGAGTVAADDPRLTARDARAARQPLCVVADSSGRTSPAARLFDRDHLCEGEVLIATTERAPHEVQTAWKEAGAEVAVLPASPEGIDLRALLQRLGRRGLVEVYCEGGARLATSLLRADLVDRLELYYGPLVLGRGGPEIGELGIGTIADAPRLVAAEASLVGGDARVVLERGAR